MIKLLVNDQELDKELHKLVIDKMKNFLRNDEKVREMLKEIAVEQIDKKIAQLGIDKESIIKSIVSQCTPSDTSLLLSRSVRSLVKATPLYKSLLEEVNEANTARILKAIL